MVVALGVLNWATTKMPRMPGVHVFCDPKLVVDFIHVGLRVRGPFPGMATQMYFERVFLLLEERFQFFGFPLTFPFLLVMDELLCRSAHSSRPLPMSSQLPNECSNPLERHSSAIFVPWPVGPGIPRECGRV